MPELGGVGGEHCVQLGFVPSPQFLAHQLTLFEPRGLADYAHHITTALQIFGLCGVSAE